MAADRSAAARQFDRALSVDLDEPDEATLALVAISLHHGYGAVESLLERVVKRIEGDVPRGRTWHQDLLRISALELEGIRPALLSDTTARELRKLLSFRHFFRHAYGVDLDAEELRRNQAVVLTVSPQLDADLDRLDAWLAALAE